MSTSFTQSRSRPGKNFDGTGAFDPYLVTADEVGDPNKLKLQTRLNGEAGQSSSREYMIFKILALINSASKIFEMLHGDVIVTGTAGVGWSPKLPLFMKDGDVVEVEVERVGLLRNSIVNEVGRRSLSETGGPFTSQKREGSFSRQGLVVELLKTESVGKATAAVRTGHAQLAITPPEGRSSMSAGIDNFSKEWA